MVVARSYVSRLTRSNREIAYARSVRCYDTAVNCKNWATANTNASLSYVYVYTRMLAAFFRVDARTQAQLSLTRMSGRDSRGLGRFPFRSSESALFKYHDFEHEFTSSRSMHPSPVSMQGTSTRRISVVPTEQIFPRW